MGEKGSPRACLKRRVFPENAAQEKECGVVGLPRRAASRVSRRLPSEHPGTTQYQTPGVSKHESPNHTGLGSPVSPMANIEGRAAFSPAASVPRQFKVIGGGGTWCSDRRLGLSNREPRGRILCIVSLQESLSLRGVNRSPWERDLSWGPSHLCPPLHLK